jgi:predicted TIM-barrel fold metal-dependent hydrolase
MAGRRGPKGARVVDADGHVVEPPWMWQEYIEPAYREYVPQCVQLSDGHDWIVRSPKAQPGDTAQPLRGESMTRSVAGAQIAGRPWDENWNRPFRTGIQGAWDPHARLKDMDADGIDAAVLYPTTLLSYVADPGFSAARCRAYNNWLADYIKADPGRLHGIAAVPLQDVPAAITELRRAVKELGFRGVFIRPNPYIEGTRFDQPHYDAFWAECQALGVPVGLHVFLNPDMPGACRDLDVKAFNDIYFAQAVSNPIDLMCAVSWFCAAGILDRFPDLKVIVLEGGGGWIWTWLERLDHHSHIWGSQVPWQKMLPSERFRRSCYISFDADEKMLCPTAEVLGSECVIWASDYPHPDAKLPGVVDELCENIERLPEPAQRNILGENAVRLYGL